MANFTELVKKMETDLKNWLASRPLPVDAAITAVLSGADAGAMCIALDGIASRICSVLPFPPHVAKALGEVSPLRSLIFARNVAVVFASDAGIERLMKGIRGKVDVESSMVAGFGAGMMFGLVTRKPAIGCGIIGSLVKGGMFKTNRLFPTGIECVMKGIREKEDLQSSMVEGFGAGMLFGLFIREPAWVVIGYGICTALARGGMFKAIEKYKSLQ